MDGVVERESGLRLRLKFSEWGCVRWRRRMRERERVFKDNERVKKELEDLRLSRQAELRVLERMKGKR